MTDSAQPCLAGRGFSYSVVLVSIVIALTGCGDRNPEKQITAPSTTIRIGIGAEPRDLDPHQVTGLPDFQVMTALFEGLVRPGSTGSPGPLPGVAIRWEVSDNGLRYRFFLRDGARWSNGDPVTARDFVFSAQRVLDPENGSPHAEWLYPLRNAESFHQKSLTEFGQVGIHALDPLELEIILQRPVPYFLELLQHPAWFPVHRAVLEEHQKRHGRVAGWTRPGSFVGNGPFVLDSWSPGNQIKVSRSPTYRGQDPVLPETILFFPIDNRNTEEMAFRRGQLDITANIPFTRRAYYRDQGHPAYREYPVLATTYLVFNTRRPPLDDARVRRALALAVDRISLTEDVVKTGNPARGFVPPRFDGYPVLPEPSTQLDEARHLLAAAGFPGGSGFPRLHFSISNAETARQVAEAIQQMWTSALGIEVELYNSEFRVYLDRLNQGDFDLGYLAWYADFVDPYAFLIMMRSGNPSNRSGWGNPRFESLLDQSMDRAGATRFELLAEAEQVLLADSPIAPLYWITASRLVRTELQGWEPRLLDLHPLQSLYFEDQVK